MGSVTDGMRSRFKPLARFARGNLFQFAGAAKGRRYARMLLLGCLVFPAFARAQVSGSLVSADYAASVKLGDAWDIGVTVENTGFVVWQAMGSPAWRVRLDQPSWTGTWSTKDTDFYDSVSYHETPSTTITLAAADLPQAAGTYTVRLRTYFYDSYNSRLAQMTGSPKTLSFTVTSGNHPPVLTNLADRAIVEGNLLSFTITATDPDAGQQVTYSLLAGSPAGASINAANGTFSWRPALGLAPSTNRVTVRVTDNGTPPLSATNSFIAIVLSFPILHWASPPTNGLTKFHWQSFPGKTYRLCYRDQLGSGTWTTLSSDIVATGAVSTTSHDFEAVPARFYRLMIIE